MKGRCSAAFMMGGDSSFIRTSHGRASRSQSPMPKDEREELQTTCVAVGGFCQPQPYVNLHQALGMSDDGFLDRISTCIVASNLLNESEVERWNETLDSFDISEFDGKGLFFFRIVIDCHIFTHAVAFCLYLLYTVCDNHNHIFLFESRMNAFCVSDIYCFSSR